MTQADRIREFLRAGWAPKLIVAELDCSFQAVASARANMERGLRKQGRPRDPELARCEHCGQAIRNASK